MNVSGGALLAPAVGVDVDSEHVAELSQQQEEGEGIDLIPSAPPPPAEG
eukprot:gene46898-53202_t